MTVNKADQGHPVRGRRKKDGEVGRGRFDGSGPYYVTVSQSMDRCPNTCSVTIPASPPMGNDGMYGQPKYLSVENYAGLTLHHSS